MTKMALAVGFVAVAAGLLVALPSETHPGQVSSFALSSGDSTTASSSTNLADGDLDADRPSPQPESTTSTSEPVEGIAPTTSTPETTVSSTTTTPLARILGVGEPTSQLLQIELAFSSEIDDVTTDEFATFALATLNDPRSWGQAGFRFVANPESELSVVLAEGPRVDELCRPLRTQSKVSCQNGPVVALNATRWREASATWDASVDDYRRYLVNHEVGHLIGQRHPSPRCPVPGAPAAVMEQQTKGLEGCTGNSWPRPWEVGYAATRPAKIGPLPSWAPDPVPSNLEVTTG